MEHLIYKPTAREFRREVRNVVAGLETGGWLCENDESHFPACDPRIRWLSHDHVKSSYYTCEGLEPQPRTQGFLNYGEGWDVEQAIRSGDLQASHDSLRELGQAEVVNEVAAYVQAWLFFGLLEAICCAGVPVEYFTREEDGETYISTRGLPAFLEGWMKTLEKSDRNAELEDVRECVRVAENILEICLSQSGPFRTAMELVEPVASTLSTAINSFIDFYLETEGTYCPLIDSPSVVACFESLVRKGWCSFAVAKAQQAIPDTFMQHVDMAGYARADGGHEQCTRGVCKRNEVDLDTYTQQHWPQRCRCRFVKPDVERIYEFLRLGFIPVVVFRDEKLEVEAIEPGKARKYIAFSHVWADGLGSCSEVGLPTCQVKRLQSLAKEADSRSPWFWIDGLCIPKKTSYRRRAIELMNMTYHGAHSVIVLDSGMQTVSRSASSIEIGWTVLMSGWMGRMWTYMEGFLPPVVYLLLKDGLYNLSDLMLGLLKLQSARGGNPFPSVSLFALITSLQSTRPVFVEPLEPKRNAFVQLINTFSALANRSTSRPDDQVLVIGLSLGLDVKHLIEVRGEERWKRLYLALGGIPWAILFDRRPKITSSPFRWAPRSWLGRAGDQWLTYDDDLALCTPDGLRAKITVLKLHTACDSQILKLRVQVHQNPDVDVYELSRTSNSSVDPRTFNVIFIRVFGPLLPRENLAQNKFAVEDVGIGYLSSTEELEYTFEKCWDIWQLESADPSQGVRTVTGEWEEKEFLFT